MSLVVVTVTRWPAAGLLAGAAVVGLPSVLRQTKPGTSAIRAEAVAGWTELIRDALSASAGLAQAIVVTAASCPEAIRPQVVLLGTRITSGVPMADALRTFADDVDDPAADFVACALMLAARARAQRLSEVLGSLADAIREDVAMRLRVDAGRAGARGSVRTIVLFSIVFAGGLGLLAHPYLQPFGTPTGQMVLAAVGACYGGGVWLMVWLVRPRVVPRILQRSVGI